MLMKIFKEIKNNIQRDWWECLDQNYLKGLVGIIGSKIFKGIGGSI